MTKPLTGGGAEHPIAIYNDLSVLIICHTAVLGGAELAIARYAHDCRLKNVSVLFLEEGPAVDRLRRQNVIDVICKPTSLSRAPSTIRATFKELRPTLVLSNSMRAATLVSIAGIPKRQHVYYVRDIIRKGQLGISKWLMVLLILRFGVGAVIANSSYTRDSLGRFFRGPIRVAISSSGLQNEKIQLARRNRGLVLADRGWAEDKPLRMLCLGRLAEWKGQRVLLRALETIDSSVGDQDMLVTIAGEALFGEDEYAAQIRLDAKKSRFEIRCPGHVDNVDDLLAEHDVLLHTSIYPEPFGQVVAQGLGSGLVVVSGSEGGQNDILGPLGIRWNAPNQDSLKNSIESAIRLNLQQVRNHIEEGFERAESLTDESAAKSVDNALKEIGVLMSKGRA